MGTSVVSSRRLTHRLLLLICAAGALLALPSPAAATHGVDVNCPSFGSQGAAQAHLDAHPGDLDGLDGDSDGVACESLPCPCGGAGAPQPPPANATPPAPLPPAQTATARVVRVVDGDTLKVRLTTRETVTVRLIGIDTPETRKPGTSVECGGTDATARMKKLALRNGTGRVVTLSGDPTQQRSDRFGRLLAYVNDGGMDFGRTMISSGWAKTYVFRGREFSRVSTYRGAQATARAAKRGVWRKCASDFHRAR